MPTETTANVCPLCGAQFTCTPESCWCASLPAVIPLSAGESCFCPACLAKKIEELQTTKPQSKPHTIG